MKVRYCMMTLLLLLPPLLKEHSVSISFCFLYNYHLFSYTYCRICDSSVFYIFYVVCFTFVSFVFFLSLVFLSIICFLTLYFLVPLHDTTLYSLYHNILSPFLLCTIAMILCSISLLLVQAFQLFL